MPTLPTGQAPTCKRCGKNKCSSKGRNASGLTRYRGVCDPCRQENPGTPTVPAGGKKAREKRRLAKRKKEKKIGLKDELKSFDYHGRSARSMLRDMNNDV